MRQKKRYDQKALTVTLNKGDVVLMRNDQFVGKRKLKDCWGDKVYTVCNQVDVDVTSMSLFESYFGLLQRLFLIL